MFDRSLLKPEVRHRLRHLPTTTSTMDVAAGWLREGAEHLSIVVADAQTAGRGRHGKVWQTFPGHSLACTFILTENTGPHLPLLAGIATLRALRMVTPEGLPLQLKWPNDVLLRGPKLAGMLVEKVGSPAADMRTHQHRTYLLGIGLNLTRSPAMLPTFPGITLADALPPATPAPGREQLVNALSTCLSDVLSLYGTSDWPALAGEYVQNCCTIGQKVTWRKPDGTELVGDARGLDASGALELVDAAGAVHLIHSGEVIAQGRNH
jgi:BirA family biotin operon repressor/biotin-[acetyl-CoA-carboxylase] ligase